MWISRWHQWLLSPVKDRSSWQVRLWFCLSLVFAASYALLALRQAFSGEYVVQDDARQHVFWMQRFLDANAFPNDLIADYFQSIAPAGYAAVYQVLAMLGIEPILASKFLPIVIGLITTGYCFGIAIELLPIPITGFIAALLMNQNLWLKDDIVSATPRAFIYPIFLAFLYYLLRRSLIPCLLTLGLQALFYPTYVLVSDGLLLLQLVQWRGGLKLSRDRQDYRFFFAGVAVTFATLLPFLFTSSKFSPTLTEIEARALPEFQPGGQISFFKKGWSQYWLTGRRSGLLSRSLFTPATLAIGVLLPLLQRLPLAKQIQAKIWLLPQLLLASTGLFWLSHLVLFKLHVPSRYTGLSFRLVITLAAAIAITILLDQLLTWAERRELQKMTWRSAVALITTLLLSVAVIFYPVFVKKFPLNSYVTGNVPELYKFFAQQPANSLIASLSSEVSNLPSFARRSILVGQEYGVPYHLGYYRQFRQRVSDLIQAQYSGDLAAVQRLIRLYKIDFWLLDATAFEPEYLTKNPWLRQFQPAAATAVENLQRGRSSTSSQPSPIVQQAIPKCQVFKTGNVIVLKANCLAAATAPTSKPKI